MHAALQRNDSTCMVTNDIESEPGIGQENYAGTIGNVYAGEYFLLLVLIKVLSLHG